MEVRKCIGLCELCVIVILSKEWLSHIKSWLDWKFLRGQHSAKHIQWNTSTITKSSPKSSRTCTQGHNDYVKRWKPLCLFQCLSDPEQRCLDAFSEVVLQEGQAQVPLGSTHCLHSLRAPLPHCSLQPLIQLAYLFQPGLWDNNYRLRISPVATTAQHFHHLASKFGLKWAEYVVCASS